MKKITQLILFVALTAGLSECKKGEDDPFISLRSRKARVAGEWKLTSGTANSSSTSNNGASQSSNNGTYSETSYTEVSTHVSGGNTFTSTDTNPYSLKMTFEKDGSFEMTETTSGDLSTVKGTWNFTGKIGDHKNKEQIVLNFVSEISSGYFSTNTGNYTDVTFNIKELRNKKMVLVMENISVGPNSTNAYKVEYVLEQ